MYVWITNQADILQKYPLQQMNELTHNVHKPTHPWCRNNIKHSFYALRWSYFINVWEINLIQIGIVCLWIDFSAENITFFSALLVWMLGEPHPHSHHVHANANHANNECTPEAQVPLMQIFCACVHLCMCMCVSLNEFCLSFSLSLSSHRSLSRLQWSISQALHVGLPRMHCYDLWPP